MTDRTYDVNHRWKWRTYQALDQRCPAGGRGTPATVESCAVEVHRTRR